MEKWRVTLAKEDWSKILKIENMDEKVELFNSKIQNALDELAPIRSFKIRSQHKFGLSEYTKNLMKKRDSTRAGISKASPSERPILLKK